MLTLLAQKEIEIKNNTLQAPNAGPLGNVSDAASAGNLFNKIISSAIGLITVIAAIWFVFLIITGALGIMGAGGDKAKMESARQRITNGIIGFVVVIAGIFIVQLIGTLLGYDLILDPGSIILQLSPTQ